MTIPEVLPGEGEAGARIDSGQRLQMMQRALQDAAGAVGQNADSLPGALAPLLEQRGLVARAYTQRGLTTGEAPDSFAVLYRNSHFPGRGHGWLSRFGLELRFEYQDLVSGATGTTHGSPYWYDRHVPFILMGAGVEAGISSLPIYTIDMAPTLGTLAGVPVPMDLDGGAVYR